ncbi:mitochondrial carrier domain-containing protein [Dunaliella salina]|uniref:Mitochondrial carrier domain-containing protein n=1 Tax=Dunaliella salina TaxID=3046 RepID=A0ABQ7GBN3_DUNSA|nr:mitochondrial carrier domain-containing protein [Dunaliella salina]|eukprot:KAF5832007.1 mitochondrial carrier domain-containing protein [Dunaliella salina]
MLYLSLPRQGTPPVAGGHTHGLGGLYRGLGWSMAGIFPEAAMCYGLHDFLKHCHSRAHGGVEPGVGTSLCFGVASAFAGQLLAYPLETIARRLQVQQGAGGLQAVVHQIMAEGGPTALYRGLGAATLRLVPMAGVSFGTYEAVRCGLLALEDAACTREANQEYAQLHRCCVAQQQAKDGKQGGSDSPKVCVPMECVPLLCEEVQGGRGVELHSYCLPSPQEVQDGKYCMSLPQGQQNASSSQPGCSLDGGRHKAPGRGCS